MSEPTMKHVVGFSGGIDSQACARWVLNRHPAEDVILLNSDAGGNEHPLTQQFIDWYSANVHPVTQVQAQVQDMGTRAKGKIAELGLEPTDPLTFDLLAILKQRFPSRMAQFCTEHLKLAPSHRWMRENLGANGIGWKRYAGVRRQESPKRRGRQVIEWDDYFGCELYHPIIDWTKQMCFDYVAFHGEQINELYTLGFNRVGCAPCINSGKDDILAWAQRSPDMIHKVREWEKRVGKTFFAPMIPNREYDRKYKAWREKWAITNDKGKDVPIEGAPPKPQRPINWVDEVVEWAKTTRGGSQYGLHVLQERPVCESEYGLCE